MKHEDNEQLIKVAKIFLILAGYWKRPVSSNALYQKWFNYYCVYMQSCILFFWILLVAEFIRLNVLRYDSYVIVNDIAITVNISKVISKVIIFKLNNILDFYDDVITKEEEVWKSDDEDIKITYYKYVVLCRKFMLCYIIPSAGTGLLFSVMGR